MNPQDQSTKPTTKISKHPELYRQLKIPRHDAAKNTARPLLNDYALNDYAFF